MKPRQVIYIAILLILTSLVWRGYSIAHPYHVTGSEGLAPVLPASVPGIERPFPHDEEKFTFAIVGDKTGGGLRNWPIFDRAMDEVGYLDPDFAIMVGDLIQGYTDDVEQAAQEWEEFYQHASRIQVPLFFLPGNHDISNKVMYEYWSANVGRTYYSFDYKGCHFILLNTEEGWRADEVAFGAEQMEWVRQDISDHRNSKHFFLFMHRPVWYYSDDTLAQWEMIESWLEELPYTVFAGHFHRLMYEKRNDRRYYVLSATGAGLTRSDVLSLGAFHHYTTVTVDAEEVRIAVIEPGSIHPHDIARPEFQENAQKVFTYEERFPDFAPVDGEGEFLVTLRNTLDKPLTVHIEFLIPSEIASDVAPRERYWHDLYLEATYDTSWGIHPKEVQYILQPGEAKEVTFAISYSAESLLPFPFYTYSISYGDTLMRQGLSELVPVALDDFTPIREWRVVGPFDLGIRERIPVNEDSSLSVPEFMKVHEPERNSDTGRTYTSGSRSITWREIEADKRGWVDLDEIYGGEFVFAYALSQIYSTRDQSVLAVIWADDVTRAFVNGQEVIHFLGYTDRYHPHYFLMFLKEGWNTVLVKNGDTHKAWGYALRVLDPDKELRFASQSLEEDLPVESSPDEPR